MFRVLVVDDVAANRYALSRTLQMAGFAVEEACNGREALDKAARADAILLDVYLPDIDGLEVCRTLRAQDATRTIPIIHVSAVFVEESDVEKARDSGADAYLIHPVPPDVLVQVLHSALAARPPRASEA